MALTPWPSGLPDTFEVSGYSEELISNTVSTQPEAGFRLMRKRFSATPKAVKGNMILDVTQKGTLDTFYGTQQGIRFQWTLDFELGAALRYFEFADPPKYTMLSGNNYRVALSFYKFNTETGGS